MNAASQAKQPRGGNSQQNSGATSNPLREFALWYWALSRPHNGKTLRIIFFQPIIGVFLVVFGVLVAALGWWSIPLDVGMTIAVIGLALVGFSYGISLVYYSEYPGGFDGRLEEYVARRVSRLTKDDFIPQYKTRNYPANKKIRELNQHVRKALHVEKARLKQSGRTIDAPVCGVLIIGPKHANKTGALWDAMEHELSGWSFVRWPHHMDHPANLVRRLGRRTVLWIDDLHDFARSGEAAALTEFIQQLRESGRQVLVLSSCRSGQHQQEAERYFRPLMNDLQKVLAVDPLPLTQQLQTLNTSYDALKESQKSVLLTMDWLQSLRVFTFPGEVLRNLNSYFNAEGNPDDSVSWDDTIQGLGDLEERFVRVDQRADAQTTFSGDRYDFRDWFSYTFFRRTFPRPHKVVEPINMQYLNLEAARIKRAQNITTKLERQPGIVIEVLAAQFVAVETLILLGDAYLNHLGENIDNADKLAIACYEGALRQLDTPASVERFPGAWAAAHVGRGTAELRVGLLEEADADFKQVTERPKQPSRARPIPPMLVARAWHGRGDVIAARIPSDEATRQLPSAAEYYQKAAEGLRLDDPLLAEAMLDRANILYEMAQAAVTQYEQSPATTPFQPLIQKIDAARDAYQEAESGYAQVVAPAVWAEMQRRQGELCLMQTRWLLPANVTSSTASTLADEEKALKAAKKARDYFIAARNIFAPSYLPSSWMKTQVGLVNALLKIASIVATQDETQTRSLYTACIDIIETTAKQVSTLAESPLDWVDLQVLRARSQVGLGALGGANATSQYDFARKVIGKANFLLDNYMQLPEMPASKRVENQRDILKSLQQQIN